MTDKGGGETRQRGRYIHLAQRGMRRQLAFLRKLGLISWLFSSTGSRRSGVSGRTIEELRGWGDRTLIGAIATKTFAISSSISFMLRSVIAALSSIPEWIHKYRVLRDKRLLSSEFHHEQLEKYLYACNALGRQRGYLRSLREGMCVDAEGNPLPWYTYPAIDQLSKWDFSDAEVFEYGCGNSTRWWAQRAKSVVSVEDSEKWYRKILESRTLPDNVTPILAPIEAKDDSVAIDRYVRAIDDFGAFDVIVVDGIVHAKARLACAEAALPHLRPGGMVILDNSDWLPEASQRLREAGLLEIDFCGNAPLVTCAETTSLFLSKDFQVKPRHEIHPGFTLGGLQRQLG